MADSYEEVENRIRKAIDSISNDENTTSIPELAKKFDVPLRRLRDRLNGVSSRIRRIGANKKLSEPEEQALCEHLDRLDKIGLPVQYNQAYSKVLPTPSSLVATMAMTHHLLLEQDGLPDSSNAIPSTSYESRRLPIPNEHLPAMPNRSMTSLRISTLLGRCMVFKQVISGIWMSQASRWEWGRTRRSSPKILLSRCTLAALQTVSLLRWWRQSVLVGKPSLQWLFSKGSIFKNAGSTVLALMMTQLLLCLIVAFPMITLVWKWIKHFDKWSSNSQVGAYQMLLLDGHGFHCMYEFLDYCEQESVNIVVWT